MIPGNQVRVSVTVDADPPTAFAIFTEETDLWWRRGPRFRASGRALGTLQFEPRPQGRLMETFESDSGPQTITTGTITEWSPPARLCFEWRGVNFAPGESTLVEITFDAVPSGTRVTVVHSGWAALRPDHPVRHSQPVPAFIRTMGMWWGDLMTALREHAARTR